VLAQFHVSATEERQGLGVVGPFRQVGLERFDRVGGTVRLKHQFPHALLDDNQFTVQLECMLVVALGAFPVPVDPVELTAAQVQGCVGRGRRNALVQVRNLLVDTRMSADRYGQENEGNEG